MSKISVTTIAGLTSGGDANTVKIESGDTLAVQTNATVGGTLGVTGETTLASHLNMGDNDRIKLGAGTDLQIHHDGTDSKIASSTGDLIISTAGTKSIFFKDAGNNNLAQFNDNSDIKLYHNANEKFATTSTGITVTGNTLVSGEVQTSTINTASSTGTLTLFGGATNKGGTIELSGGNNTGATGSGIVFKTGASTSSPSEKMRIDQYGHVTKPLQPAFMAKLSSDQLNFNNDSNHNVLAFATEIFDQNADYNNSNYTFTAPITGRYQLSFNVYLNNIDTAATFFYIVLKTSNRDILYIVDPNFSADLTYYHVAGSILCDMDASDTAQVTYVQAAGTAQVDANAGSYFSGYLVA